MNKSERLPFNHESSSFAEACGVTMEEVEWANKELVPSLIAGDVETLTAKEIRLLAVCGVLALETLALASKGDSLYGLYYFVFGSHKRSFHVDQFENFLFNPETNEFGLDMAVNIFRLIFVEMMSIAKDVAKGMIPVKMSLN